MPDDYPCLVTHPPVLGSTGHNYYRLAPDSRNLGCGVTLASLSLPPPTKVDGPPSPLGSATRPLDHRSAHAGASPPDSDCLVLLSLQHSSNALRIATSPAVAGRASRDGGPSKYRSMRGIPLRTDCSVDSPDPGMGTYPPSAPRRPRSGEPVSSSLAGGLEGRFIGNASGDPVGRLATWELNCDGGLFGVGEDTGPIQEAFGTARSERPPRTRIVGSREPVPRACDLARVHSP